MSVFRFGRRGGVLPGQARCPAGTRLLRGYHPDFSPNWFGPAVAKPGTNRFDLPMRQTATDPGTCYFAASLAGVLLERVIRDTVRPTYDVATLRAVHALSYCTVNRDLVVIDLLYAVKTVHGLEMHDITAPPPYTVTQQLADAWSRDPAIDGVAYGSRFGATHECLALWSQAASAITWGPTTPIDQDLDWLIETGNDLGIVISP
jgi:hypothetical protein